MKKVLISIVILGILFQVAFAGVSKKQDEKNRLFLKKLDENILSTIDMLTTFNKSANNIPNFVKGVNKYKTFLMEMTIESSKIRDGIIKSEEMNKDEREFQIRELILSIKSDEEFPDEKVTKKKDKQNREYLEKVSQNLHLFLNKIRGKMMKQEKEILSKEEISDIYFAYHSRNFLYSILLDYLKINDLLSRKNRDYLANVVFSLENQGAFTKLKNERIGEKGNRKKVEK